MKLARVAFLATLLDDHFLYHTRVFNALQALSLILSNRLLELQKESP